MKPRTRSVYTEAQKALMWDCWRQLYVLTIKPLDIYAAALEASL